ncbi:MAG: guanitoxin biosynthesis MBL fold metallo-hydrolase GntH [Acidimicrobiales bacterium]
MARKNQANPYGSGPGMGTTLPDYYRPTKYVKNNQIFAPGLEAVGPDEMRISFIGSCPWPPRRDQAATSIMVELGNGDSFFFDLGPGSVKNAIALQKAPQMINDIFITHLHFDHWGDVPYLYPFTASMGRWKDPLRITGPDGDTEANGTRAAMDRMKEMLSWHLEEFEFGPIGDGYEIEVTEFDHRDENAICYDKNGVTVRHWPRSHGKNGASAYRLDWNGLSFVWTGDGRPDELSVKYGQGVDVFVTETQSDLGKMMELKMGVPDWWYNYMIDTHHTPHFAAGYMFDQVQPRIAMVTHMEYENDLVNEVTAGIREHYDGLFAFGAPDVVVVNVTKDAIWVRDAALPSLAGSPRPNPAEMFPGGVDSMPDEISLPPVRRPRESQQDAYLREIEIDPRKYLPDDLYRDPVTELPDEITIDLRPLKEQLRQKEQG